MPSMSLVALSPTGRVEKPEIKPLKACVTNDSTVGVVSCLRKIDPYF